MRTVRVFYRIYPGNNGRSPIFSDDKIGLVRFCLRSFVEAFKASSPHVTFILDSCDSGYRNWIEKHVPFEKEILSFVGLGHVGSFFKQVELACKLEQDDLVFLAEDDYYYVGEAGPKLAAAMERFDFVTPYDHAARYSIEQERAPCYVSFYGGHHWRTQCSTCLTFGARVDRLSQVKETIFRHGVSDHPMWVQILRERPRILKRRTYRLYGPIPSLATHLVAGQLAPGFNWEAIWKESMDRWSIHPGARD